MANKVLITDGEGTSGQVLTSNGAGAAPTFQDVGGGGGLWEEIAKGVLTSASGTLFDESSISTDYDMFRIKIFHKNPAGAIRDALLRFNNDSGSNYDRHEVSWQTVLSAHRSTGQTSIRLNNSILLGLSDEAFYELQITKPLTTTRATVIKKGLLDNGSSISSVGGGGTWNNTSEKINRISIVSSDGTSIFDPGSFYLIEGLKLT